MTDDRTRTAVIITPEPTSPFSITEGIQQTVTITIVEPPDAWSIIDELRYALQLVHTQRYRLDTIHPNASQKIEMRTLCQHIIAATSDMKDAVNRAPLVPASVPAVDPQPHHEPT